MTTTDACSLVSPSLRAQPIIGQFTMAFQTDLSECTGRICRHTVGIWLSCMNLRSKDEPSNYAMLDGCAFYTASWSQRPTKRAPASKAALYNQLPFMRLSFVIFISILYSHFTPLSSQLTKLSITPTCHLKPSPASTRLERH